MRHPVKRHRRACRKAIMAEDQSRRILHGTKTPGKMPAPLISIIPNPDFERDERMKYELKWTKYSPVPLI